MNPLHLSGWGVKIRVQNLQSRSELEIVDGREDGKTPSLTRFKPRWFPYSSLVIDGHSGYISLQALHWLSRNKVPVFVMNYDGTIISSILPPMPIKAGLRAAQFQAASDPKQKFAIAHALVQAKIARSLQVLEWLGLRYEVERETQITKGEASKLGKAATVSQLRTIEGRVALRYWEAFKKALPEWLDFQGRMTATTHQNNASDPFNAALNYGYGFLEAECRMAINAVGLEPGVGYLHDFSGYQTKESLAYDLQEPFRWLVDVAVLRAFESGALNLHDFYFTGDDYRYRFEREAKQRFIDGLRERFNLGVQYKGRVLKWDTVIEEKTTELGRYLTGRSPKLDFAEPSPSIERFDSTELRRRIKSLTPDKAKELGINKSTLYTLRQHVRKESSFRLYGKVRDKLEKIDA
jgi:CRISPR-associated protein Cas1